MIWQFDHTKIKTAREIRGLTQEALALAAGIRVQQISRLETGAGPPNMKTLERLCAALQFPPEFFFIYKQDAA